MKAWRVHQLGDPVDVLTMDDIPEPEPGPGSVVVEMGAASLNFPDVLLAKGEYQEKAPLPFIATRELAGRVVAASSEARTPVGTRVIATPPTPQGGLAERVVVPESEVFPIPDALDIEDAAALQTIYQTAHLALHRRAHVAGGETVLVLGGSGGVGTASIQLAKAAGCRVLATASGDEKLAVCRRLGADAVMDYRTGDLVSFVKEATGDRGAGVVIDPIGGDLFDQARRVVAQEGRLVVIGFVSGRIPQAPANHLLLKNYSIVGLYWGAFRRYRPDVIRDVHADLMRLYEAGTVRPAIYRTFAFDEARDAFAVLESRQHWGKLVVRAPSAG